MNTTHRRLAAIAACAFIASGAAHPASASDVVVAGPGGISQEAMSKALFEPAAEALGWTVEQDTSQSWSEARAQVDAGAVTWDIISLNMGEVQLAVDAGVLYKLPADIVDRDEFVPGTVNDYCIGNIVFSTVIGYSTEKFGDDGPENMQEFWDVESFPGTRGLFRSPRGNVEAAVLALGYPQSEVYDVLRTEEGREAAFEKIAELDPSVLWWESGAQATQLVKDGEVDLIYSWNGRIQAAIDDGAPFKIVYQDGLLESDCFAIVNGGPNTDNAVRFLQEISKAEYVKDLPNYVAYGGANLTAYADYDEETISRLTSSPDNVANQYPADVDFWGANGTMLSEEFDTMLLTRN